MVRLLNLDEEDAREEAIETPNRRPAAEHDDSDDRLNLNSSNGITAALRCYPIVSQLASQVDLNTLDELSRTCRQVRADLLEHRKLLIAQTLRCENEKSDPAQRLGNALSASFGAWTAYGNKGAQIGRITSGKVGACARDMVGECRRCERVICRNCVLKPPSPASLQSRHRRLCPACMKAPLERLTRFAPNRGEATNSEQSARQEVAIRAPCTCDDSVWICQDCGQSLRADDTIYFRAWNWRNRYADCGGIGAGLGEGNEGQGCGRGTQCLAANYVEHEKVLDTDELAAYEQEAARAELEGHSWIGNSYTTQEVVGIGGRFKIKRKTRELVATPVQVYIDEAGGNATFLSREHSGVNRSWCSWCARVIPSKNDIERPAMSSDSIALLSSM